MAYQDLQEYIEVLEKEGLLHRISTQVDWDLEITEITDRIVKSEGPALLFSNVKGSKYSLFINGFGSMERMALALGVESLDMIGDRIAQLLKIPQNMQGSIWDRAKVFPMASSLIQCPPKIIKKAPCQSVVEEEPDLYSLPILKCWPLDGGRFITLPLVFTKNPISGMQNCGMYRMQILDRSTTGMHWHIHKDGYHNYLKTTSNSGRMEVAVALGCDPATIYSATAPLPPGIDEMMLSGFLRQKSVEMVKCLTLDLMVPAHAEFILEGYVDASKCMEGPFGDHNGFYSLSDEYPVFHVKCITHKKSPVYPATVVGKPPMEDYFLGKATERIFLPLIKMIIPEIIDINFPCEGVVHNCLVVSIEKTYPGQASKVVHAIWGLSQMMFTKTIIVVDKHVDVQDMSEVWWRVFNNIDAKRDLIISHGPLDVLDHSSPENLMGSKIGIDATNKMIGEGRKREWPQEIVMLEEIKNLVTRRWQDYGFS